MGDAADNSSEEQAADYARVFVQLYVSGTPFLKPKPNCSLLQMAFLTIILGAAFGKAAISTCL